MIKTNNLQKVFRTDEVETWALNDVSIEVKEGEFVAIMGPSKCRNTRKHSAHRPAREPSGLYSRVSTKTTNCATICVTTTCW